jgi:large subunit ribosomal protein L10
MKKKQDKINEAQSLREDLKKVNNLFLTSFEKLKVSQDFELRKTIREAGGRYRVIKNNVAGKAAEGTPAEPVLHGLQGMNSLAYTESDPVALAKALTAYSRANPTFTFKAGIVEGRVVDVASLTELATMPSKEEMLARLLFMINAPAQRLAQVINAVGRNLTVVVDQGVKENKFSA